MNEYLVHYKVELTFREEIKNYDFTEYIQVEKFDKKQILQFETDTLNALLQHGQPYTKVTVLGFSKIEE